MFKENYEYKENPKDGLMGIARNFTIILERLETIDNRNERIEQTQKFIKDLLLKKPEFLSVGEVALIEGVCDKTIRNRIKEGKIPALKNKGERSYKIPRLEYFETHTKVKSNTSYRNAS